MATPFGASGALRRPRAPLRRSSALLLGAGCCTDLAVGIAEEDERAPWELLDLADLDAALEQLLAASMSETTSCRPCTEPGGVSTIPVPRAIEQADPGRVSWTKRISSLTAWSWSALNPGFSV
ncbi:MAG: hypothetical protein IRZ21_03820 [Thermoleophilaceae bacterium]|nr:hypothetical protein [Thermoleophilaceae bacterium]